MSNPQASLSVNTTILIARAIQVQDMLSTFSRNSFPSEYIRKNIYDRISLLAQPEAIDDCVIKEDLESTMFLLAVNSSSQYEVFHQAFPEERRARFFEEKLRRRIETGLNAFDLLGSAYEVGVGAAEKVRIQEQVATIAAELEYIVRIVKFDRSYRQHGETETASHLVYLLQEVCNRNYLFQVLIGNAPSHSPRFGLDALRVLSRDAIREQKEGLDDFRDLLVEHGAPQEYVREFDEIRGLGGN